MCCRLRKSAFNTRCKAKHLLTLQGASVQEPQLASTKLYVNFHSSFLVLVAKVKASTHLKTVLEEAYTSRQAQAPPPSRTCPRAASSSKMLHIRAHTFSKVPSAKVKVCTSTRNSRTLWIFTLNCDMLTQKTDARHNERREQRISYNSNNHLPWKQTTVTWKHQGRS